MFAKHSSQTSVEDSFNSCPINPLVMTFEILYAKANLPQVGPVSRFHFEELTLQRWKQELSLQAGGMMEELWLPSRKQLCVGADGQRILVPAKASMAQGPRSLSEPSLCPRNRQHPE